MNEAMTVSTVWIINMIEAINIIKATSMTDMIMAINDITTNGLNMIIKLVIIRIAITSTMVIMVADIIQATLIYFMAMA
jgi:hypothetical protein